MTKLLCLSLCIATGLTAAEPAANFDVLIKNGTVYDGSGGEGRKADIGIRGDRIIGVGEPIGSHLLNDNQISSKNTIASVRCWLRSAPAAVWRWLR